MSYRQMSKGMLIDQAIAAVNPFVTAQSAWVSMADWDRITYLIAWGVVAAANTIDASLEQATTSAGAGVKAVTGSAITQVVDADDNKFTLIELAAEALDVDGGFDFVRLSVVKAGATAISGVAMSFRYRGGVLPPTQPAELKQALIIT